MKDRPIISNQHGALVMAFVPFFYAIFTGHAVINHIWLGISWLFLYLFSYPFFGIFNKKNPQRQKKWAAIYALISLLFALPLLWQNVAILQFSLPILPLVAIQIYYAKQKNERHLLNDIAGILTFGVVGMAAAYLATGGYRFEVLLHPSLFFIATTFYIKSVARERKNPRYRQISLLLHLVFSVAYALSGYKWIALAYFIAMLRAWFVPQWNWNIKQVGVLEFATVSLFLLALIVG